MAFPFSKVLEENYTVNYELLFAFIVRSRGHVEQMNLLLLFMLTCQHKFKLLITEHNFVDRKININCKTKYKH